MHINCSKSIYDVYIPFVAIICRELNGFDNMPLKNLQENIIHSKFLTQISYSDKLIWKLDYIDENGTIITTNYYQLNSYYYENEFDSDGFDCDEIYEFSILSQQQDETMDDYIRRMMHFLDICEI